MSNRSEAPTLPRPYYGKGFGRTQQAAAEAFWDWYLHLNQAPPSWAEHSDEALRTLVLEERPLPDVPEDPMRALYQHADAQGVPLEVFARQIRSAVRTGEELRFSSYDELETFMEEGVCMLAEAHMHLLDMANRFQLAHAHAFARALFYISRLIKLPEDVKQGRLFIPLQELEQYGIEEHRLFRGEVNEPLRRVLWRVTVRARDELAQAEPLAADLPWRARGVYKRFWIGGLDALARIERRNFDVWSRPINVRWIDRFRIRLHSLFSRSALSG